MSKNMGKRSDAAGQGNPVLVGLLMGLIVGVGLAAGLAWYLMRSPSPFTGKDQAANKPPVSEQTKAAASAVVKQNMPAAASGVGDGKPRFEFYKVLTDKQDASVLPGQKATKPPQPKHEAVKPAVTTAQPVAKQIYYLQVGAFANEADAEKLKAGLIFEGMEVTVLAVNSPDKGLLHKVRVGPYQGTDEMNGARAKLQLKGIDSTPMRGQ